MGVAMSKEFCLSLTIFVLFLLYGFSNLYIIIFLRVKNNYIVGLSGFISLFMGNIKNYKKLNDHFVNSFMQSKTNIVLNRCISVIHLVSPLLIPLSVIIGILSIGFY